MRQSELEIKYLKNRAIENKAKCQKQNNFCNRLINFKIEQKLFYSDADKESVLGRWGQFNYALEKVNFSLNSGG